MGNRNNAFFMKPVITHTGQRNHAYSSLYSPSHFAH